MFWGAIPVNRQHCPFLPAGVGRARGRRVCGMSVGPRARCVMCVSALRCFIKSKDSSKKKTHTKSPQRGQQLREAPPLSHTRAMAHHSVGLQRTRAWSSTARCGRDKKLTCPHAFDITTFVILWKCKIMGQTHDFMPPRNLDV